MRQKGEAIPFVALLFIWSSDHQPSCHIKSSLRSKRFRAVSEQRTRNESQKRRQNGASKRGGGGQGPFFSPKPNGKAFYAGYIKS